MRTHLLTTLGIFVVMGSAPSLARAQSLGTFSWQLQPYCNVVSVSVIQQGAVYTLDGYDDQCGAAQRAPLVGIATPNPDGTIGLGLNIVTVPGGRGVQVEARITLTTAGGLRGRTAPATAARLSSARVPAAVRGRCRRLEEGRPFRPRLPC